MPANLLHIQVRCGLRLGPGPRKPVVTLTFAATDRSARCAISVSAFVLEVCITGRYWLMPQYSRVGDAG